MFYYMYHFFFLTLVCTQVCCVQNQCWGIMLLKQKGTLKKRDQVSVGCPGETAGVARRCGPTADHHGKFDLLWSRLGRVHHSLDNLILVASPGTPCWCEARCGSPFYTNLQLRISRALTNRQPQASPSWDYRCAPLSQSLVWQHGAAWQLWPTVRQGGSTCIVTCVSPAHCSLQIAESGWIELS